jgi:hypothetical protein
LHRIAVYDLHVVTCSDILAQHLDETVVDLDCGHACASLGECEGERAEPGANLEHVVTIANSSQRGDASDSLGFDDEVLAEHAPRGETVSGEQLRRL